MKTTTKPLSKNQFKLEITIDSNDLINKKNKVVEKLAKGIKVPGFRSDKIPLDVAEKNIHPEEIANTVINDLINESLPSALVSLPQIPMSVKEYKVAKFVPYTDLEFSVEVECLEKIKVNYKNLKTKKAKATVSKKEIDEVLLNIARSLATAKKVERKSKKGDEVVVDFVGKKGGEAFAGGTAKDQHIVIGENRFIPGFEDSLIGRSAGDKFDQELVFPKDYHEKSLAGAKVVFSFEVKSVNELVAPELNDELVSKNTPLKNLDELVDDIKNRLTADKIANAEFEYKEAMMDELINSATDFKPTAEQVNYHLSNLKAEYEQRAKAYGITLEDLIKYEGVSAKEWEEKVSELAQRRAKSALILEQIARNENLVASDLELKNKIEELKEQFKDSKSAINNLKNPFVQEDIRHRLTIDKTMSFLTDK